MTPVKLNLYWNQLDLLISCQDPEATLHQMQEDVSTSEGEEEHLDSDGNASCFSKKACHHQHKAARQIIEESDY